MLKIDVGFYYYNNCYVHAIMSVLSLLMTICSYWIIFWLMFPLTTSKSVQFVIVYDLFVHGHPMTGYKNLKPLL
jgi:hypothetical protein